MTRRGPTPEQMDTQTSLVWHKTTEVKERIKTATGTIPVYSDMSQDEIEKLKESVAAVPSLEEAQEKDSSDTYSAIIAETATSELQAAPVSTQENCSEAQGLLEVFLVF